MVEKPVALHFYFLLPSFSELGINSIKNVDNQKEYRKFAKKFKIIKQMEITGKIIHVSEPRGGVSARTGNSWKMQDFVIETMEQYPRKCMFNVFGEDRLREFHIQAGEVLTVSFDIDAREYNGRWYNDIRAWRVVRGEVPAPGVAPVADIPAPAAPAQPATVANEPEDDLPF